MCSKNDIDFEYLCKLYLILVECICDRLYIWNLKFFIDV